MRFFPRTARHRLFAAASAGVLALGAVSVPLAHADDLDDRRKNVEKRLEHADHALEESSARMRRAAAALDAARAELDQARAELASTLAQLDVARERDEAMRIKLEQARARLEQAQAELATGRADLSQQREAVTSMVTQMYQDGDTQLETFASMMQAQNPADLTWAEEARDVVVQRETRAYDELRASEVLLQVREEQVAEAEAEVEVERQEAAEHLVVTQDLTARAREAKARVVDTVTARRSAQQRAAIARQRDLRDLQKLKAEEQRITELIARRSARASTPSYSRSQSGGGFLSNPIPGGYVTSPFGMRTHPIYGYYSLHNGTDFGGGCGLPLVASASGTVVSTYYSSTYGNRVFVHVGNVGGKSLTIVYNHLSSDTVSAGQRVERGQVVGYSGTTGWSTACHLHFTVLVNGQPVNPMGWL
ncbi:M23 family metallopeptidase [Nocardioides euryhalodurans]|uniref:M23ase beta-sheet core domain-containing protein n=1 Tax=Nocardioides euryhalodurans TaxID=2518370 RepID=A0A4P7GNY1_9ACTN|nr:M23 family metallopeptidase [Nocardioides euryhalodurans]QBR93793.1 hypothetical protein EXE57_17030 [Nocardioides euryhalodurans]